MNPRERILAMGVLSVVLLAGGAFLFNEVFWSPLQKRGDTIVSLQDQIEKKKARIEEIRAEQPTLERWRALSLPSSPDLAKLEYERWLTDLVNQERFANATVTPKPVDYKSGTLSTSVTSKAPPVYVKLGFSVTGRANLASLVRLLEKFYSAGLLHQVRTISIQRPLTQVAQQQRTDLDINLSIEALCLTNSEPRKVLLPVIDTPLLAMATFGAMRQAPVGLAFVPHAIGPRGPLGPGKLARSEEEYAEISRKDIFFGGGLRDRPGEYVDPKRFVHLTDIIESGGAGSKKMRHANLYDVYGNHRTRLQAEPNSGYTDISIKDDNYNEVFHGKVVKINDKDVIFKGNDNYYRIKVGGSMEEALKKPLRKDELELEGLVKAPTKPAVEPVTEKAQK